MNIFISTATLFLYFVFGLICLPYSHGKENTAHKRINIPPFAINNAHELEYIKEIGIPLNRIYPIIWNKIEPNEPKRGKHTFDWSSLDEIVKKHQSQGILLTLSVEPDSRWASEEDCLRLYKKEGGGNKNHCPVKNKEIYLDYFEQFIKAMVERYDHDGIDDMPGLKMSVDLWQFGAEYNAELFWQGTNEQYLQMWKRFSKALHEASSTALIISNGISSILSVRRIADENGEFSEEKLKQLIQKERPAIDISVLENRKLNKRQRKILENQKRSVGFFKMIVDHPDLYDIFDGRMYMFYKYQPNRIHEDIRFIKDQMLKRGYQKPIMVTEGSGAFLGKHGESAKGERYFKILQTPREHTYDKVLQWHQRQQAIELIKEYTSLFSEGVISFVWYYFKDLSPTTFWGQTSYRFCGLLAVDDKGRISYRKPAFFAYKLLFEKVSPFNKVTKIISSEGIEIYEYFKENGEKVWVGWYNFPDDDETRGKEFSMDLSSGEYKITSSLTKGEGRYDIKFAKTVAGKLVLELTEVPVFIESNK